MKLKSAVTLQQLAELIGKPFKGPADLVVTGLNEIHKVRTGDLSFVDFHKYYERALTSSASVVLINADVDCPQGKGVIISDDPFRDYNKLVLHYYTYRPKPGHYTLMEGSVVGEGTMIRQGVFIDEEVIIGENCILHPNVVIYPGTIIGDNVIIHANTTIGADAFYYKKRADGFDKLLSCGRVIIHDNVEVGANCAIDKGVSGDTIIGKGTKIDNQVHIGHGVEIGTNCLIAAQVGIGGKTIIEDDVTLWGQVGVQKDILIEKGAVVLAQSGVSKSIKGNKVYFGSPAVDAKKHYRELGALRSLPFLMESLNFRKNKEEDQ